MEEPKAPKWYDESEIQQARWNGAFFEAGETESRGIARHLQLAFEKGHSVGWRKANEDLILQKSALETDLMRLMTAIGPYSTVDSAAKFATKTRQQWADLVEAARAMVKHQRDRHELSSCCYDVTPTPTYLLEKALGDMADKPKEDLCATCGHPFEAHEDPGGECCYAIIVNGAPGTWCKCDRFSVNRKGRHCREQGCNGPGCDCNCGVCMTDQADLGTWG